MTLANSFLNWDAKTTCVALSKISQQLLYGLKKVNLQRQCQLLKERPGECNGDDTHIENNLNIAGQWYAKIVKNWSYSLSLQTLSI